MGSLAFYMIGFQSTGDHFVKFLLVLVLFSANCGLFALNIGMAIPTTGTANLVASISVLFMLLFAGFLLNPTLLPTPVFWIQYLSLFKYAYEALSANDIVGLTITATVSGASIKIPGTLILQTFGLDQTAYWKDVYILCGILGGFLFVMLIFIKFRFHELR